MSKPHKLIIKQAWLELDRKLIAIEIWIAKQRRKLVEDNGEEFVKEIEREALEEHRKVMSGKVIK